MKGFEVLKDASLANLLITILTAIGFMFLIIPGIFISAIYLFTMPLVIFRRIGFWQAMEESRKLTMRNPGAFFLFSLTLGLINLIGALAMGIGLLLSVPLTAGAILEGYEDRFPQEGNENCLMAEEL
jgi:uncharacterized membrane protein